MVKKITLVCGIALVLSVLATVMVVSPALADSPFVVGNQTGAVVTNDFPCGILVPTGGAVLATDSHDVQNSAGEETLVCSANVVNPTGQAASLVNIPCFGSFGVTLTDHTEESASGELTLTCHFPTRP